MHFIVWAQFSLLLLPPPPTALVKPTHYFLIGNTCSLSYIICPSSITRCQIECCCHCRSAPALWPGFGCPCSRACSAFTFCLSLNPSCYFYLRCTPTMALVSVEAVRNIIYSLYLPALLFAPSLTKLSVSPRISFLSSPLG